MLQVSESTAALIIPALNEEAVIGATLESVPRSLFRAIVVVDNGSTDRTAEIARSLGALVLHEPERGYGAACLRAISALPGNVEILVFLQADSSEDPAEADRLLAPIQSGRADLVIGSRTLGAAEPGALLAHQRLGNALVTWLVRLIYGYRYSDLGPFRAIRREAFERLQMRDRNYGWTVEMQVRALQEHLRVLEVPVTYRKRSAGENKVSGSLTASLLAAMKMIWTVLRLSLGRGVNKRT